MVEIAEERPDVLALKAREKRWLVGNLPAINLLLI